MIALSFFTEYVEKHNIVLWHFRKNPYLCSTYHNIHSRRKPAISCRHFLCLNICVAFVRICSATPVWSVNAPTAMYVVIGNGAVALPLFKMSFLPINGKHKF